MAGRMGNQMCRYACARGFQKRMDNHEPIAVDFSKYPQDGSSYATNYLDKLQCKDNIIEKRYRFNIFQKLILKSYNEYFKMKKITNKKMEIQKVQNKTADFVSLFGLYIYRRGYHSFKHYKHSNANIFLEGNFEGHKYFDNVRDELLTEFLPVRLSEENEKLYNKILNGNYIAVCVRKGDFTSNNYPAMLDICTPEYYAKGIKYIKSQLKEEHKIIVFTADEEWAKNNLSLDDALYLGSNMDACEQMKIMSACNHFVICNSTFFWWAQYLANKPGKIVVAPSYWSGTKRQNDLYMDNWHLIDPMTN